MNTDHVSKYHKRKDRIKLPMKRRKVRTVTTMMFFQKEVGKAESSVSSLSGLARENPVFSVGLRFSNS